MRTFLSLKRHLGLEADGRAEPACATAQTASGAWVSASAEPAQSLAPTQPSADPAHWLTSADPAQWWSEGAPALLVPLVPTCATLCKLLEVRG